MAGNISSPIANMLSQRGKVASARNKLGLERNGTAVKNSVAALIPSVRGAGSAGASPAASQRPVRAAKPDPERQAQLLRMARNGVRDVTNKYQQRAQQARERVRNADAPRPNWRNRPNNPNWGGRPMTPPGTPSGPIATTPGFPDGQRPNPQWRQNRWANNWQQPPMPNRPMPYQRPPMPNRQPMPNRTMWNGRPYDRQNMAQRPQFTQAQLAQANALRRQLPMNVPPAAQRMAPPAAMNRFNGQPVINRFNRRGVNGG